MRVLVTGVRGFVGRAVAARLRAAGHLVRGTTRASPPAGGEWVATGPIGADTDWAAALEGVETVVHLAARVHRLDDRAGEDRHLVTNALATERLAAQAVTAGVRRFVFLSTVKVHGEASPADPSGRPLPLTATSPLAPADPYARSKLEAERRLARVAASGGMAVTVLRPTLVYGPGVGANFLALMRAIDRGWPLPLGAIDNRRSLCFVDNLAEAVAAAVEGRLRGTFLVADGEDLSTPELARRLARALGRPARLVPVPPALLAAAGALTGRRAAVARLAGSLTVDVAPLAAALGAWPPYPLDAGLAATAAWYRVAATREASA